jgi:hypothetical protein
LWVKAREKILRKEVGEQILKDAGEAAVREPLLRKCS